MAGAVIRIDQIRPGPTTSSGTAGIARADLWLGSLVEGHSTLSGNTTFAWTLPDKPAGSAAVLSGASTALCSFTPDVAGTYRLKLVTNGGGTGNEQTLIAAVTFDAAGVATLRGWRVPAYGEKAAEANQAGNARGWAEALETMLKGVITALDGLSLATAPLTQLTTVAAVSRVKRYPVAVGEVLSLRAIVTVRSTDNTGAIRGEWEIKGCYGRVGAGTLAAEYAVEITETFLVGVAPAPTVTLNGNTDVDLNVTGTADALTWEISEFSL